ncbi:MAG: hypothetical protein V1793_25880 [Pseudomonadota bacterium]
MTGMTLDGKYHGYQLPGKFKMAVSGCPLSCSESWVRDIGLIGKKDGWTVTIGGNVGAEPCIGQVLVDNIDDTAALSVTDKVIGCYQEQAKPGERLAKTIDRVGMEVFRSAVE